MSFSGSTITQPDGLTSAQVGARLHPGYLAGSYQWTIPGGSAVTLPAVDTLILHLFPMPVVRTLARLHMRTRTGGAASAVKWGFWAVSNGRPTGLPIIAQNTGLATTANDTWVTQDVTDTPLTAPWYAFGAVFTGTLPTMTGMAANSANGDLTVFTSLGGATGLHFNPTAGYTIAQTYPNDIAALDLTGAALTPATGNIPGAVLEFV